MSTKGPVMEFNVGEKKIKITKKKVVRGVIAFTAGAGAYIIVRKVIKINAPTETMNILGKGLVAVGAFFLANAVADKVSDSAGKFVDECYESYETTQKATQEFMDAMKNANS